MYNSYRYSVQFLSLFSLLLVTSGVLLFNEKLGMSIDGIMNYYEQKSFDGILKLVLPHTFAYGLYAMVLLHFLVFTSQRGKIYTKFLVYAMFVSAFFEIVSSFGILQGYEFFAYMKLLFFILLNVLILLVSTILFLSALHKDKK